jgi:hypothetical protein
LNFQIFMTAGSTFPVQHIIGRMHTGSQAQQQQQGLHNRFRTPRTISGRITTFGESLICAASGKAFFASLISRIFPFFA